MINEMVLDLRFNTIFFMKKTEVYNETSANIYEKLTLS